VACGATRSDLTAQFLTYTHSIVDGKACAKEHAKVKSGCVDLQAKPGSSIMKASITSFLPKDDYTEFSAFSIETLVHQGNLNKSYSLMSSEDTYNPAQGIRLTYKSTNNYNMFMARLLTASFPTSESGRWASTSQQERLDRRV